MDSGASTVPEPGGRAREAPDCECGQGLYVGHRCWMQSDPA